MQSTRAQFARYGIRCTRQRLALYEALRSCKTHPSADELHQMFRTRFERMSLATVYNTLEAFSAAGLVRKIPTTNGTGRYDADLSDHLHLQFRDDDRIVDVPQDLGQELVANLPEDVLAEIGRRLGVEVDGIQIQLIGGPVESTE